MCCCFLDKDRVSQARQWHSVLYLCIGVIILFCYLGLSIAFYIECNALNDESLYPFQCGSNAMWSCMGWVPFFFFIILTALTFYYLHKQSSSTMKVLSSSDAWLLLFVTIACCVLFFIHLCYLGYISSELLNNEGCSADTVYHPQIPAVDCTSANELIAVLLFFAACALLFVCTTLAILFALVNGRIATPVNYKTVKQQPSSNMERAPSHDSYGESPDPQQRAKTRRDNLAIHKHGDRVIVKLSYEHNNNPCCGTVMWFGQVKSTEYPTESTTSLPFLYGVFLDEKRGNCDGSIRGKHPRPFKCPIGFGVFVPINHIRALSPDQDPTHKRNQSKHTPLVWTEEDPTAGVAYTTDTNTPDAAYKRSSINKGLVITRGHDPMHLHQGELFFFLRKLNFSGVLGHSKIGVMDYSDKIESIKTKSMISVIFPTTNQYIYNYLPLLSSRSEYDKIFNPERNSQIHVQMKERNHAPHDAIEDEKEKEEDSKVPIVSVWYLRLHESWLKNSKKIKSHGISDYSTSQWVIQSEQRALHWYSLLNINKKMSKYRFDEAPLPLFFKQKSDKHRPFHDDIKSRGDHDGVYSNASPHYVPLGIFHNKPDAAKNAVAWLESEPFTELIDIQIELRLKRLIHEPVQALKDILPYLHSKQYKPDATDADYGWFPMDWVYAEVDIDDNELEEVFAKAYKKYTPPFADAMDVDKTSYNPYWFMKYPRIPLFVVSIRLPVKALQKYAVQVINEKYGHSPMQHSAKRHHHPPLNTSISVHRDIPHPHHHNPRGHHKRAHKSKTSSGRYTDENEYAMHRHKYQIPPKQPKAPRSNPKDEEVSVSFEVELEEDEREREMERFKRNKHRMRHDKHRKKKKSKNVVANGSREYEFVEQSDDEEDENDEDGEEFEDSEYEEDEEEETLSNEEEDTESYDEENAGVYHDKTEDDSDSEEYEDDEEQSSDEEEEEETESTESEARDRVRYKQKSSQRKYRQ